MKLTPRIGCIGRPNREWEVWNDNYSRVTGEQVAQAPTPWVVWHPCHELGNTFFHTHADAMAELERFERS